MTGKLFEYLAAGRPILCIPGHHDCVDEMLQRTKSGVSCATEADVVTHLLFCYRNWLQTGNMTCCNDRREIGRYSRREQAGQLAAIYDPCAASVS